MKAYRAALLYFTGPAQAAYEADGLLVTGPDSQGRQVVQAVGSYQALVPRFADVPTEHLPAASSRRVLSTCTSTIRSST
jgi:guanine deaminase